MRISDCSSDVCSSDLRWLPAAAGAVRRGSGLVCAWEFPWWLREKAAARSGAATRRRGGSVGELAPAAQLDRAEDHQRTDHRANPDLRRGQAGQLAGGRQARDDFLHAVLPRTLAEAVAVARSEEHQSA